MATVTEPRAPRFMDFPPVMAVKTFLGTWRERFETEKLLLRQLRGCPHVIQYLGHEETLAEDGTSRLYLFLELPSEKTLLTMISESNDRLEEDVARRHAHSVLSGVKRIHDEGYVLCFLMINNVVLVEEDGEMVAKLADLEFVKRANDDRGAMGMLAPEGWLRDLQGKPSDIWALGVIVLKMLGGKMKFSRFCRPAVMPVGVSQEATDFMNKCLVKKPKHRATAEELMRHPFVCTQMGRVPRSHLHLFDAITGMIIVILIMGGFILFGKR